MTVYSNPTLDAKTQKLYKKIDTESDAYIIQANGTYKNVTNTSSFFEFDITNTAFTAGNEPTNALIMLWTGEKEFSDVAITDENGKSITPSQCYTDDYGVLHIAYEYRYTQKTNVTVHIDW